MPALVCFFLALAGTVISLLRIQKNLNLDIRLLHKQLINAIVDRFSPSTAYQFSNFEEIDSLLVKVETKARTLATLEQKIKQGEFSQSSNNEKQTASNRLSNQTDAAKSGNKSQQGSADAGLELQQDLQKKQKKTDSLPIPQAAEIDVSSIFRAYDIRGIVGTTLTNDIVTRIGLSIGTQAKALGEQTIVVAGDGRLSSPDFVEAMIQGLTESGCDVLNIGLVPTPLLYYATHNSHARSGVMITGSHNPSNYNGIKVVLAGKALVDDEIQGLYQKYLSKEFSSGEGSEILLDITEEYIDRITDDVLVAQPLKIVIDCGNGIAGLIAPDLFTSLGCEVIPLFCDIDGNFPNHHPDPIIPENLESLTAAVLANQADLGIAFDGDGDRLVAVTAAGDVVWPDKLMMLFAKDIVSRNPGADVVYDIKCSAHLNTVISEFGGRPIICRSGHSFIKAKMIATNAILGGEMSGHLCFKERWFGFDDGLYAAARLLEIIGSQSEGLAALIADFPLSIVTPEIQIPVTETNKFEIIQQISNPDDFDGATITTIDGFRVDYDDRWGLVRASNTSPNLTLRFEANDEAGLEKIQTQFRQKLTAINKNLTF
ncbi:MAG: phosphomannomutase/phosphoglucomutase [Pseudomonadales bacterium]|nr:phosphomannomutase/phosphoglucomutase [Pseudomonadales bacterium]